MEQQSHDFDAQQSIDAQKEEYRLAREAHEASKSELSYNEIKERQADVGLWSLDYISNQGASIIESPLLEAKAKYFLLGFISSVESSSMEREFWRRYYHPKGLFDETDKADTTWNATINTRERRTPSLLMYGDDTIPDRDYADVFGDGTIRDGRWKSSRRRYGLPSKIKPKDRKKWAAKCEKPIIHDDLVIEEVIRKLALHEIDWVEPQFNRS